MIKKRSVPDREARMLRLWQSAISPVDAFYAQMAEGLFGAVKWALAEKINERAGSDGRLSACDERIFEYYRKLMLYYNNALSLFTEAFNMTKGAPGQINEILSGVMAVINSRLRAFDEGPPKIENISKNPVKAEKLTLISNHIRFFSESFDVASYRPRSELYAELFQYTRLRFVELARMKPSINSDDFKEFEETHEGLRVGEAEEKAVAGEIFARAVRVLREKGFPQFYELYTQALRTAANALNDFYSRNAAAYYNHELMSEHEILRNLATVQVLALDQEAKALPLHMKTAVETAINGVLNAYQILSRDVAEIAGLLSKEEIKPPEEEDWEVFEDSLLDAVLEYAGPLPEVRGSFRERLNAMGEAFTDEFTEALKAGMFSAELDGDVAKELLADELGLALDIRSVFAEISKFYKNDTRFEAISDSGEDYRISEGIAETVFIKTESLDEAVNSFKETCEPIVQSVLETSENSVESSFIAEIADSAFGLMVEEMAHFQKEDRRALSAVKKYMAFSPENEIYAAFADRLTRPAAKALDQLKSRVLKFKREQTLYEISTFEEILLYSVSRLRGSDKPHIIDFVNCLDRAVDKLNTALDQYGITPIRPQIGEVFNGKEHEILMAEENENFKKGEIIKLLNSGYKQGEDIILRANVIAAK